MIKSAFKRRIFKMFIPKDVSIHDSVCMYVFDFTYIRYHQARGELDLFHMLTYPSFLYLEFMVKTVPALHKLFEFRLNSN